MRSIAIMNGKGGSGKTTTSVNLSACLGEKKKKVLLFDTDPFNLGTTQYLYSPDKVTPELLNVFLGKGKLEDLIIPSVVGNVDLIPCTPFLIGFEKNSNRIVLPDIIGELPQKWDYLIIDCPPTIGLLTMNVAASAGEVLIPVESTHMGILGIGPLLEELNKIKNGNPERGIPGLNHNLKICGILACRTEHTNHSREIVKDLQKSFPKQMFRSSIRKNVKLQEASSVGLPIIQYSSKSAGAADYRALAKELIRKEKK